MMDHTINLEKQLNFCYLLSLNKYLQMQSAGHTQYFYLILVEVHIYEFNTHSNT